MNEIRDIHKPLIQWLRANNLPYINHRPDVKSGIRSGWPDFSIFLAGRCLFLEAKTEKGVVSAKQWRCIADLERSGNPVKIVRSESEAISAVMEWAGVEKASSEASRRSECPLDNERAAELIAAATSRPLWIANIRGVDQVLYGDPNPGGLARILRKATPQDIRDLPRK